MYIYIHTSISICIYIHIYVYIYIYIIICKHLCTHANICMHTREYTDVYIHIYVHSSPPSLPSLAVQESSRPSHSCCSIDTPRASKNPALAAAHSALAASLAWTSSCPSLQSSVRFLCQIFECSRFHSDNSSFFWRGARALIGVKPSWLR